MASEADVPFPVVKTLRHTFDLAAIELIDVDVENLGAVQRNFDRLSLDFNLFVVPLANWAKISMLGTNTMVEGAVILKGFQRCVRMFCIVTVAIDDLNLKAIG